MGKSLDFEKARDYIVSRLTNELSARLTYHRLDHTVKEVAPAAQRLAIMEKVEEDDRLLLLTAAYYHDAGFIFQREGHEAVSIGIAVQNLSAFGYTNSQVAIVSDLIQATHIPQSPTNLLGMIMADADLDYLGNEHFWERSQDLRQELENYGASFTDRDWHLYQLRFIQAHHYFTASAGSLRDELKHQHLMEIQKQLDQALTHQNTK